MAAWVHAFKVITYINYLNQDADGVLLDVYLKIVFKKIQEVYK